MSDIKLNISSDVKKVIKLNIIDNKSKIKLNIIETFPSDHICYILKSSTSKLIYIGYTINFQRRIRQHNGEIKGGAKRTKKNRPWYPICLIRGFFEKSSALRFEYRLQITNKINTKKDPLSQVLKTLEWLINNGDGSISNSNKMDWPLLNIKWYYKFNIKHERVINVY